MTVVNGTVLVSRVNESSNAASFVKLDSNGNKLVEQNYYSGLCGTPKIIVMNNKTYVSTRSSSNELYLYAVDESNNTFTPVIEKQLAKSYGLATDGKNLYIATGTDKGIQMIIYDGNTVQVKPEVAMDNYEPEIAFTQGNVYVVASSKTTDRTLGVYEYNVANNTYTLEGTSVGKSLSGYTLSSSNENLYISFEENSKVVVKKKISSNELLSLTITPPNKISYIQGESVDTTGLVVTANYRKDTRVLNSGDYAISGFDTSVAGESVATISFGGKTNTFTYVVAKKLPILASITVDVVTNEYKIGSSLSEGDIKIVANYDNATKKELSLSDVTITNFATTNTGDYTATVEYQGKTGTFMYKVVDNTTTPTVTLVGITVNVSKNEFEVGSSLTDGDIKVVATYSNNSQKELDLSDVVVRNFTTTSEGNYTATVEYQGKTCDFTYKVVASQGNNPSTPNMVDKVINDDKTVINSDNITEISTEQQLKDFRDDVNNGNSYEGKVVLLTSDMDLGGEGWKPIGYYMPENVNAPNADNNKPFRGIFDGCGYEIDNFTINSTEKVQGLFGLVNGAKIANLGVGESASVSGEGVTGGVIAYAYNETKVNNCYSKASVKGTSSVGGIVGNSEKNSTVLNCYNSGSIEGTGTWIGGIVGQVQLESIVETSYNEGSVYGKSDNIGGIAGKLYINCIVRDCYNIGEITGDEDYIGGVVGHIQNSSAENCYNTGVINGNKATEINSVIGRINLSTVNNCYALEGQYSNETSGIKVLNSDELENAASFLGNKFKSNTTGINNNYYPILYWQ